MTGTVYKTIELLGVSLDVIAEFDAHKVDSGIGAYEFWGQRCVQTAYDYEIDCVDFIGFDGDEQAVCADYLASIGAKVNRKRFRKLVRQLVRGVNRMLDRTEANSIFDDSELVEAAYAQFD